MKPCNSCKFSREHRVQISYYTDRVTWRCMKHTQLDPVHGRVPSNCYDLNTKCDCPDWEQYNDTIVGLFLILVLLASIAGICFVAGV
jgi:hypothetical protein